jgi:hypothetical protein
MTWESVGLDSILKYPISPPAVICPAPIPATETRRIKDMSNNLNLCMIYKEFHTIIYTFMPDVREGKQTEEI